MKFPFLLGRLMFGGYFLYSGINHFQHRETYTQYAGSKGVPMPDVAVPATGALLMLGGTSILLGIKPKVGALAIMGFLAGVSPMMHDFWKQEDPGQRQAEMINFTKNLALLGGAMALLGIKEPWPASVPVAQPSTGWKSIGRKAKQSIRMTKKTAKQVADKARKIEWPLAA